MRLSVDGAEPNGAVHTLSLLSQPCTDPRAHPWKGLWVESVMDSREQYLVCRSEKLKETSVYRLWL